MADAQGTAQKGVVMDSIMHKGNDVSVGIEGWVTNYERMMEVVAQHNAGIAKLEKAFKFLDQEVSRISNTLNTRISEQRKAEIESYFAKEKEREEWKKVIVDHVEKEVEQKRHEIMRRVELVEERASESLHSKAVDAAEHRGRLDLGVERLGLRCKAMEESISTQVAKMQEQQTNIFNETKKSMRQLQASLDEEKVQREKLVASQAEQTHRDVLNHTKSATALIHEDAKRIINALDIKTQDHVFTLTSSLTQETQKREDLQATCHRLVNSLEVKIQADIEAATKKSESETDKKLAGIARFFPDTKMAIETERATRSNEVADLRRALSKEKSDRDIDEHKLMAMIQSALLTLQKMHYKGQSLNVPQQQHQGAKQVVSS